jgi:hypothetical protein
MEINTNPKDRSYGLRLADVPRHAEVRALGAFGEIRSLRDEKFQVR